MQRIVIRIKLHFTTIRKTEQTETNFRLGLLEIVYHALRQVLAFLKFDRLFQLRLNPFRNVRVNTHCNKSCLMRSNTVFVAVCLFMG